MKASNTIINSKFPGKANKKIVFLVVFVLFSFSFAEMTSTQDIIDVIEEMVILSSENIDVFLDRDYVNNQCFLCYDICQDTATDLTHEMYEQITINKKGVIYYEDTLNSNDIKEALKMGYPITYTVYTDYIPPTFLKNNNGELVDSRYRGKMIFLGDEYMVNDWNDNDKILKLAKGAERQLDNKAFGGDFTAGDGTYQFKINRAIFDEGQVAGIVVDVKKPDGAEVSVVAQRSLNAVVEQLEIYVSNVATASNFVQADVILYDLSTGLILKDNRWFSDKEEWLVELESVPLKCLADIPNCASYCNAPEPSSVKSRFNDYDKVDENYCDEGMLKWIHLTLITTPTITEKQNCPYECCVNNADYSDKSCSSGYSCINQECIKQKQICPFDCCISELDYFDKSCSSGYSCINHECIKQKAICPFDCCVSESDYMDKSCSIGYRCVNHKCIECESDNDCDPGEYCSLGECKNKKEVGKSCSEDYECISESCVDGKCIACESNNDCDSGEYCSDNQCETLKSTDSSCSKDSECTTKNCFKSVCREEEYCDLDSDCSSGEYCSDNRCETLKPIESSCSKDSECTTDNCFDGVCREQGYECESASNCSPGEYCSNNRCETLRPIGSTCYISDVCETRNCVNYVCREEGYSETPWAFIIGFVLLLIVSVYFVKIRKKGERDEETTPQPEKKSKSKGKQGKHKISVDTKTPKIEQKMCPITKIKLKDIPEDKLYVCPNMTCRTFYHYDAVKGLDNCVNCRLKITK